MGFQVWPASSERNGPAAEMAMTMRSGLVGSRMMVWRQRPPAPGCQCGPVSLRRRPEGSCQCKPPSVDLKSPASSAPAKTVSGSVSEGSRCQTRLNSQGWGVPSYHWWVPGTPSYTNLLPTGSQVLPPSEERWINCPNQPVDCDAYNRSGSAGDPFM